jgi:uncharacterized protein YeeX (DUF496 family)
MKKIQRQNEFFIYLGFRCVGLHIVLPLVLYIGKCVRIADAAKKCAKNIRKYLLFDNLLYFQPRRSKREVLHNGKCVRIADAAKKCAKNNGKYLLLDNLLYFQPIRSMRELLHIGKCVRIADAAKKCVQKIFANICC